MPAARVSFSNAPVLAAAASAIGRIGVGTGIGIRSSVAAAVAGLVGVRSGVVVGAAANMVAAASMAGAVGVRAAVRIRDLRPCLARQRHQRAAPDDGSASHPRQKRPAAELSYTLH